MQQSGSDIHTYSYCFPMEDVSQVGEARRFASLLCETLHFTQTRQGRIGIVINELGNNLVKYATGGQLILRSLADLEDPGGGIEILSIDRGPGLSDVEHVLRDGVSSRTTPGTGLGAVERQADEFDIYTNLGRGTVIIAAVYSHDPESNRRKSGYVYSGISVPIRGETLCGDAWLVREDQGQLSAIMVDGLGHGPEAHKAALAAVEAFDTTRLEMTEDQQLNVIHSRMKSTRGGAVFLLRVALNFQMEFSGVGNIRALIHTADKIKTLISQNGTAGLQIRKVKSLLQDWDGQGFLILHSDGITSRWDLAAYPGIFQKHPAIAAGVVYRDFSRNSDDTTVLVIGRRR